MRRLLPLFLTLMVLLSGCATSVTWNLLQWNAYWSLGDYMALESGQKQFARETIDQLFDWHRNTELPVYASTLQGLAERVEQPMQADDFAHLSTAMLDSWDRTTRQLLPHAVDLFTGFSDEQVNEMDRRLESRWQEDEEEYAAQTLAERNRELEERMIKYLQRVAGKLDDRQRDMITEWSADLADLRQYYLRQSDLWRGRFIAALAERHDRDLLEARLADLFAADGRLWPAPYRQAVEHNQARTFSLLAQLVNSLSNAQRERLQRSLRDYAADLERLAAGAAGTATNDNKEAVSG